VYQWIDVNTSIKNFKYLTDGSIISTKMKQIVSIDTISLSIDPSPIVPSYTCQLWQSNDCSLDTAVDHGCPVNIAICQGYCNCCLSMAFLSCPVNIAICQGYCNCCLSMVLRHGCPFTCVLAWLSCQRSTVMASMLRLSWFLCRYSTKCIR
jgi:hypothetical protein